MLRSGGLLLTTPNSTSATCSTISPMSEGLSGVVLVVYIGLWVVVVGVVVVVVVVVLVVVVVVVRQRLDARECVAQRASNRHAHDAAYCLEQLPGMLQ